MIATAFRTVLTLLAMLIITPPLASCVVIAGMLGMTNKPGSIFDWAPRVWSRWLLAAAGARVVIHGGERRHGSQHIFVGNHVSWFDVFAMAAHLRWFKFVAKAELFRIPFFGPAMRRAGMISIERSNHAAARASIEMAREAIAQGASVILFPEGTRGRSYSLRPFKKGAFVLAAETHAPIVPVAIYGTIHVQPRGTLIIRPGVIHLHFLEPISTDGCGYDDRDALAAEASRRIAACLEREHGVTPAR